MSLLNPPPPQSALDNQPHKLALRANLNQVGPKTPHAWYATNPPNAKAEPAQEADATPAPATAPAEQLNTPPIHASISEKP